MTAIPEPCLCGALDCRACRGPDALRADYGPAPTREWLYGAGYVYEDGYWSRKVRSVRRVARRAHHGLHVGDTYVEETWRHVNDESGGRAFGTQRRLVRRAGFANLESAALVGLLAFCLWGPVCLAYWLTARGGW